MNLEEYEKQHLARYHEFAQTVRSILEKSISSSAGLPRPQSIQCRAKSVDSLRRRLTEAGKLDTSTLEIERRDLAGVRLIFYTNNDVDRFLASGLIRANFEIEEASAKIHHPTPENEEAKYRAVHFTVRLLGSRTQLPEYADFRGLRCEIQVQTILNHAWSETSHDVLYKNDIGGGYGSKAMEAIARRFNRIMDRYLIPAGFEIQKAQRDYDRLRQGKELFDKDIASLLDKARDNNERYEILSGLKDYAIPNYDDLPAAYQELRGPLLRAVRSARATDAVPIETTYGTMEGFRADAVTKLVVEMAETLRYVDAVGTLKLLIDIFRDEPNEDIRQQITNAVKHLAEYNIDAYRQVGPMLQMALVDHLGSMTAAELDLIRPIALTIWTEAIESDITGARWKADSVVLSTGAVPASSQLQEVRNKAINGLFGAYSRATDDRQKREIFSALDAATRTPNQAQYSNELLATTLKDTTRIVAFVTENADVESYELLQHLENRFLFNYFRAQELVNDADERFGCKEEAASLVEAILKFRDTINADRDFARYKVLVGFESVYPAHWASEDFDHRGADEYRRQEVERYIGAINDGNEDEWLEIIERCALTKSDDLATFPVFSSFVVKLAECKPELSKRFLAKASDDLRRFLPAFLNGLALSARSDIYNEILEQEIEAAHSLAGVARHLRYTNAKKPDVVARVLKGAIERGETSAVVECLVFALEHYDLAGDAIVRDALDFLNASDDACWIANAWYQKMSALEVMPPERIDQILENFGLLPKVNYQAEAILSRLAHGHRDKVWDYFGKRLAKASAEHRTSDERFEAAPFRLHGLEKELSKDPDLAIRKGLAWYARDEDRLLFQFRGGHFISSVFPRCTTKFADALVDLVQKGADVEVDFALAVLRNYEGETSAHAVLREIVARFPNDSRKLDGVSAAIDSTGVVSGELGFANAWRRKRDSLTDWLLDERLAVQEFAKKHIATLDIRIADEHRRAEAEREMRRRNYADDDESSDSENDDGE